VDEYCAEARTKLRGNATVLKCLVENFKSLTDQCQTEMSRAVRLALWDYKPGAALTQACDDDVDSQCPRVSHQVVRRCMLVATAYPWAVGARRAVPDSSLSQNTLMCTS
jgi:hypothetical protein